MSANQQLLLTKGISAAPGQVQFTTPGTYFWTCPAGVYIVSVVCVGAGGSVYETAGGGGGLRYGNNIPVSPGTSYQVVVGGMAGYNGGLSSFNSDIVAYGGTTGTYDDPGKGGSGYGGNGGGSGGSGGAGAYGGGGGAGGYTGNGGNSDMPGSGGGGGGGGSYTGFRGGGGVGIYGQGASGAAGTSSTSGGGGSGGNSGTGNYGGSYGGGGITGASGAVRIIWPGNLRQFPSTRTADE